MSRRGGDPAPGVLPGVSRLLEDGDHWLRRTPFGLIEHPASVTPDLVRTRDALLSAGFPLKALFGPQHGARGEKQDNMIESEPFCDPRSGLPVHSLYGEVRKPTPQMLTGLDALVFDLQDVGVRIYTFIWTMTLAMEACRDAGIRFVVLDRPNPITGTICEGPLLHPGFESFVGLHPIPLRHGLTTGELARLANERFGIGCELEVVPCGGWERTHWFDDTGLPFILPSPNLPTLDACIVYPGMVLLEGTNLSEGRGTTKPFELFGAPYLDPDTLIDRLDAAELPGVTFRACHFEPTFQKHSGTLCAGAQLHVTDRATFRPVDAAVTILSVVHALAPEAFAWRDPPYEYETEKPPIDILWGSATLREAIDDGADPRDILASASRNIEDFHTGSLPYRLY